MEKKAGEENKKEEEEKKYENSCRPCILNPLKYVNEEE